MAKNLLLIGEYKRRFWNSDFDRYILQWIIHINWVKFT